MLKLQRDREQLFSRLLDACEDFGRTSEQTIDLIWDVVDSIEAVDEPMDDGSEESVSG